MRFISDACSSLRLADKGFTWHLPLECYLWTQIGYSPRSAQCNFARLRPLRDCIVTTATASLQISTCSIHVLSVGGRGLAGKVVSSCEVSCCGPDPNVPMGASKGDTRWLASMLAARGVLPEGSRSDAGGTRILIGTPVSGCGGICRQKPHQKLQSWWLDTGSCFRGS